MAGSILVKIDREKLTFKAEVEGMRGQGCTTELDAFQKLVGMTTREQQLKPDFDYVHQRVPQKR